jgi:hypothetical protein
VTLKKQSAVPTKTVLLIVCFVVMGAVSGFAQSKDDLYNRGNAAVAQGDAIAARDAFCAIKDDAFKDAKSQCTLYTGEATRALNRYNQNFFEGVQLKDQGKLADAAAKFRNVKAGERVADAQRQLQIVLKMIDDKKAADAQASQNAAAEGASKTRLDAGIEAYSRGDFNAAKAQLDGVTGAYQGQAQSYLSKIGSFNAKMSEARGYEAAKNYQAASAAFAEAARISSNGPGDPLAQVQRMATLASAGSAPVPAAPVKPIVKEIAKIDVAAYLAEGKKAAAKGDNKKARRFFNDVLAQDFKNAQAREGLDALPKEEAPKGGSVGEAEPILAKAILEYYDGKLNDSEDRLKFYCVQQTGKKEGMCKFYLGVIQATRYYLQGGGDANKAVKDAAESRFREAAAVNGFVVPEKLISPKILKMYQDATKAKS